MSAIIFDLDGTLIDSAPDIHFSANILLIENEYEAIDIATIRSFIGNGVPKLVERIMRHRQIEFSTKSHQDLCEQFIEIYSKNPIAKTILYPNVRKTLDSLYQQGFKLGICTNKMHAITKLIIKELKIDNYFSSIIGGDSLPTNKPDPKMLFASINELGAKKSIFVGDSEIDASTAQNANVPFVLFTEGYLKAPLDEVYHSAKFSDFSELEEKLRNLNQKHNMHNKA